MARAHVSSVCVALCVAASCAKPPTLSVDVSTGQETGVLSIAPVIKSVTVVAKKADGTNTVLEQATATAPDWTFDLGTVNDTNPIYFDITGFAADGKTVLAGGQSVTVVPGAISNGALSLFLERLGGFSRPNGGMSTSHVHGQAFVVGERYVMLTGGDKAENTTTTPQPTTGIDGYDLLSFGPSASNTGFDMVAETIVTQGTRVLLINHDTAEWFDLSTSNMPTTPTPPTGLTWADVAGGKAIEGNNGTFVVGATRETSPTGAVLVIDSMGNLTAKFLSVPRAGAAAGYVGGHGVVVAFGASKEPGVEVIPDDTTTAPSPLAYPGDATTGAALAPASLTLPIEKAFVVGGTVAGAPAASRVIDLGCVTNVCAFADQGTPPIDTIASRSQAFVVSGAGALIVIGDDPNGQTRAFQVVLQGDQSGVTELPFRDPRKGATAIDTPNGLLAVLGGELISGGPALSVELLFPP